MTWRFAFFFLLIAFVVVNCNRSQQPVLERSRMMQPLDMTAFHPPIMIELGWMPYQEQKLIRTGRNDWKVIRHEESDRSGMVPVILVSYPESDHSILLDMNIENELLGKLIKHSAITQEPITRPFSQFFEVAKCEKCHPEDVKVDFGQ